MGEIVPMPQGSQNIAKEETALETLEGALVAMKCEFEIEAGKVCGEEAFHKCTHCGKPKCGSHTSNVDPSSCEKCCEDVKIEVTMVSKKEEEYDEINDETLYKSYQAKNIHFSGQHWLNNQAIIGEMSDAKIRTSIEYYKTMVKLIEEEQVRRKISKAKKAIAAAPIFRRMKRVDSVTSITTEKKTTVRRQKKPETLGNALDKLVAAGKLDPQKMIQMLQEKLAKKNLGIK